MHICTHVQTHGQYYDTHGLIEKNQCGNMSNSVRSVLTRTYIARVRTHTIQCTAATITFATSIAGASLHESMLKINLMGGLSTTTGGAGVLTTDTDLPVVTETSVETNLLHSLDIVTKLGIQTVGNHLEVGTFLMIVLSVQKPLRDVELFWVVDDGLDGVDFFLGQLTGALVQIDISLLAQQVGETTTDTSDLSQSIGDLREEGKTEYRVDG